MINHHSLKVERTAHYSTYGNLTKQTKYIWIACHGYGQLASRMVNKFDQLDAEKHFVVAAEGLNSFYWHKNNEPVCCWMTSKDRYDEIQDFCSYLDQLHHRFCRHTNQEVKVILFGFSQGCATIWRWIHASRPKFDILINWAGWIPEDISYRHLTDYLNDKQLHLCVGNDDHFMNGKVVVDLKELIVVNKLQINIQQFDGGHKIEREPFHTFIEQWVVN